MELTPEVTDKMKEVVRKYGGNITITADNKISIKNKTDLDTVVKLFCDYYKLGMIFNIPYGVYHGKVLKTENS